MKHTLYFFLIVFYSCSLDTSTISNTEQFININKKYDNDFFNLIHDIKLIPLETSSLSIIGKFAKLIYFNHKFFILDINKYVVKVFNENGNYEETIQNIGDFPEGYHLIYDMEINPFTNELNLLSPDGKIIEYSLKNKTFKTICRINNISSVYFFINISPDIVVLFSKTDHEHIIYYSIKTNTSIMTAIENSDKLEKMNLRLDSPFFRIDGKCWYLDPYSNVLYLLSKSGLIKSKSYNFLSNNLNLLDDELKNQDFISFLEDKNIAFPIKDYFENKNIIYFTVNIGNKEAKGVKINKLNGDFTINTVPVKYFVRPISYFNQNKIFGLILRPEDLPSIFNTQSNHIYGINSDRFKNEELNPIIMTYDFN